jgi:hypothetical protein
MEKNIVRSWCLAALVAALFCGANVRPAGAFTILPDRLSLDRFLRSNAVHDNFERFPVDAFGAIPLDVTRLDASTITNGHGPGLVVPGITLEGSGGLQWNGRGYFGQPSRTISGVTSLELDFHDPVTAFGLDLLVFARFPDVALVSIFGADDRTLLATFGIPVFDPSFEVFFGIEDRGGIGRVAFAGTAQPWSPALDDLTFGSRAVPEPGLALLVIAAGGAAAYRCRRLRTARTGRRAHTDA